MGYYRQIQVILIKSNEEEDEGLSIGLKGIFYNWV